MITFKKKGQTIIVKGKEINEDNLDQKLYSWVMSINEGLKEYFKENKHVKTKEK